MPAFKEKINCNLQDKYGNTPFHYCSQTGDVEMMKMLMAAKAKKLPNLRKEYPIHLVIESGNSEALNLLEDDLNESYLAYHPIHSAARSANTEMLRRVYLHKKTALGQSDSRGMTALHHAVASSKSENCQYLCSLPGTLINHQDAYGNTALHIAFANGEEGINIATQTFATCSSTGAPTRIWPTRI